MSGDAVKLYRQLRKAHITYGLARMTEGEKAVYERLRPGVIEWLGEIRDEEDRRITTMYVQECRNPIGIGMAVNRSPQNVYFRLAKIFETLE